jgi:hypothetical protein
MHAVAGEVDFGGAERERCRRLRGAPLHRDHARRQFVHAERLHHVVVGADVQAEHALLELAARGERDHRRLVAAPAQAAQQVEPIAVGQAQVEQTMWKRWRASAASPLRRSPHGDTSQSRAVKRGAPTRVRQAPLCST